MAEDATLKKLLKAKWNITITPRQIKELELMVKVYELRDQHSTTLNTPLLGITDMFFLGKDQQRLYEIFGMYDIDEFTKVFHSSPNVDTMHKVTSNPYNFFTVWIAHLIMNSTLSSKQKEVGLFNLFKLLHYKFFTSVVNHNFPYKAHEDVMGMTIDELPAKFIIKKKDTSTWKLAMEQRAKDVYSKDSIHYKVLKRFEPDSKVLYIISDISSRLRMRLRLIVQNYYKNKEENRKILEYGIVKDVDGTKIIQNTIASYDKMCTGVASEALIVHKFINFKYIKIISQLHTILSPDVFRSFLTEFSSLASYQYGKHQIDEIVVTKKATQYIGYRALITAIIQTTYRTCIRDKVRMDKPIMILSRARDIFKSSRVTDPAIHNIKDSVDMIIANQNITNKDPVKVALRIGFITYILLLSFDQL